MPVEAGQTKLRRAMASRQNYEKPYRQTRFQCVCKVLDNSPQMLYEYEQDLIRKKYLEPMDVPAASVKKQKLPAITNGDLGEGGDGVVNFDPVDSKGDEADDNPYNRNVTHYHKLTFETVARGLRKGNGVAFSKMSLNNLKIKKSADKSLLAILEVLEFHTDVHKDESMETSIRTRRASIEHIAALVHQKKDRQDNFTFPADYKKSVHWKFKVNDTNIIVTYVWSGRSFTIQN